MLEETFASSRHALHEQLSKQRVNNIWILLDPTLCALGEDEITRPWARMATVVEQPPIPGYDMGRASCPLWLRADIDTSEGRHLLDQSLEMAFDEMAPWLLRAGAGRRICGWIASGNNASPAHSVARRLVHRRSEGGSALVRLYDPAVLWVLWGELLSQQKEIWLSGITDWWILRPDATLKALREDMLSAYATEKILNGFGDVEKRPETKIEFSLHQWRLIDGVEIFNPAMNIFLCEMAGEDLPSSLVESARKKAIDAILGISEAPRESRDSVLSGVLAAMQEAR